MTEIKVNLKPSEREALRRLSAQERRDPSDQVAVIVVRALEIAGLLPKASAVVKADVPVEPGSDHA